MRGSIFADVAGLSKASGLDSVEHEGPSTIGIDTLFLSQGKIPETFLRGCGVPDALIVQQRALVGSLEPIQFYSCFLSYSTKNQDFAERLHSKMRDKGLRVWFWPEDIQSGKNPTSRSPRRSGPRQAAPRPITREHEQRVGENRDSYGEKGRNQGGTTEAISDPTR